MKALDRKTYLAGFGLYFVVTRPLLPFVLDALAIPLGDKTDSSVTLLVWAAYVHRVIELSRNEVGYHARRKKW